LPARGVKEGAFNTSRAVRSGKIKPDSCPIPAKSKTFLCQRKRVLTTETEMPVGLEVDLGLL
jgi:hypothetical protein